MTHWIRSLLQLLILLLGGFLLWRYRDMPWGSQLLLATFFLGLFLFASVLGSRYTQPGYEWPPSFTENTAWLVSSVGLGLPLLTWSPWPLFLLLAWWAFLIAYLLHPAGSDFHPAKRYFLGLGSQACKPAVFARRCAFIAAFWPVFIPKAIWFWASLILGGLWLLRDFLFRQT